MKTQSKPLGKFLKGGIPDKQLIDLATEFSEKYKSLPPGNYFSDKYKYEIFYGCIRDRYTDRLVSTPARISHWTGEVGINRDKFTSNERYTENFCFYMIIWCVIRKDVGSEIEADRLALKYYFTTGRSKKDVLIGYICMFEHANTYSNGIRYNEIETTLREKKVTVKKSLKLKRKKKK